MTWRAMSARLYCAGGFVGNNPFGEAFEDAGNRWTDELCRADSDGGKHPPNIPLTPPEHPLHTTKTLDIHPLNTPSTPSNHLLHTPFTSRSHPLHNPYTPYTPPTHTLHNPYTHPTPHTPHPVYTLFTHPYTPNKEAGNKWSEELCRADSDGVTRRLHTPDVLNQHQPMKCASLCPLRLTP